MNCRVLIADGADVSICVVVVPDDVNVAVPVGTVEGDQLAAVFQSKLFPPQKWRYRH